MGLSKEKEIKKIGKALKARKSTSISLDKEESWKVGVEIIKENAFKLDKKKLSKEINKEKEI